MPLQATPLTPRLWVGHRHVLETELLKAAKRAGCRIMDGGHMNVGWRSAASAFTGRDADAARMDAHFRSL
jgi:shikimate dehydrogenase